MIESSIYHDKCMTQAGTAGEKVHKLQWPRSANNGGSSRDISLRGLEFSCE